ncbi:hypothetical protein PENSPDRAFT_673277 [Peniophora sp. CONT]|nr:hypothetical protein PENSPDRAFT_673277 [Peniophora sp. CONT]
MPSTTELSSSSMTTASARLTSIASHLSTRRKVVVTRDLGPDVMPLLRAREDLEIVAWPEHDVGPSHEWTLESVKGAEGVLVLFTEKVNDEFLDAAGPGLKVVSTMSVGYDHISLPSLDKRGVKLGYTPDVLTDAVADISVMLALMAGRNGAHGVQLVSQGKSWQWPSFAPFTLCGPQLSTTSFSPSRTVGFLGFGRIAQATLARLVAFGVNNCLYCTNPSSPPKVELEEELKKLHPTLREIRKVDLEGLARESDVLFILAPGGPSTHHIIGEDFLRKMKKHAVLVNTARGTLVDSDALARALHEEWIWGAGLDVLEGEPHISIDHPLLKEPRCSIVPHIGSATFETRVGMARLAVENMLAGIDGTEMPAQLDIAARLR